MRQIKVRSGRAKFIFILTFLFILGFMWTGHSLIKGQYQPVDSSDKSIIDINIPAQSSAKQIARLLADHDLIHNEKVFLRYCSKTGYDNSLKAGHYQFSRSQSLQEIVQDIAMGRIVTVDFTIPEGYTIKEIGELLIDRGLCSKAEWQAAVDLQYDYDFLQYNSNLKYPLEGFLFPDTYRVSENTDAETIIKLMLNNFQKVWQESFATQVANEKIYEIITIASMIEKEASTASERPTISGVIANRLRIKMPLQIDATVIYALGEHKEVVYNVDLNVESPYNTYKYGGLPIGPIASPGQESIEAAINPEKHKYFYYVAKGDGSHHFSKTHDEHIRAKAKYID